VVASSRRVLSATSTSSAITKSTAAVSLPAADSSAKVATKAS